LLENDHVSTKINVSTKKKNYDIFMILKYSLQNIFSKLNVL